MSLECPICKKQFLSITWKRKHFELVHENAGNLECSKCDQIFTAIPDLIEHENNSHKVENLFRCAICRMRFASSNNLQRHHRCVHTNERPFKCVRCGYAFKRIDHLKNHKQCPTTIRYRNRVPVRKVERLDGDNDSWRRARYSLRTRDRRPNYRDDQNDVDESSESRSFGYSAIGDDDFQDGDSHDELYEEDLLYKEEERKDDQNGGKRRACVDEEEVITTSSDESDRRVEMPVEWSTGAGAKLKLVFDVEYVPPE